MNAWSIGKKPMLKGKVEMLRIIDYYEIFEQDIGILGNLEQEIGIFGN